MPQDSKLEIIRRELNGNSNVNVVYVDEKNYLPGSQGYFSQTFDIFTAPKKGMYTAKELQEFMMSLISIQPTMLDKFSEGSEMLEFGKLYFDEVIGHRRIVGKNTLTVYDPELLKSRGKEDLRGIWEETGIEGEWTMNIDKTEEVKRRTWVRVYPTVQFAEDVLSTRGSEYRVRISDLERYGLAISKTGLLKKIFC